LFGHHDAWANGRLYAHWFNQQSHHRGQIHALLTGLPGEAPELDLLFF
jgi:uncharacterized damage-inducible protein DinB